MPFDFYFFWEKMCPSSPSTAASNIGVFSFFRSVVSLEKVFSGQCSVGSAFYSTETRAGKRWERQSLCPLPKT
ncbi:MAG: hypothetical protein D6714_08840, partial [Bacteroidetes bacterium]